MKKKHAQHPVTQHINHQQSIASKTKRQAALHWLKQQFPLAFDNSTRIRPLKIGIMNDILQYSQEAENAGISRSKLREAVVFFTRRLDYLTTLKAQEVRIDLNGNPVVRVTEAEAVSAASKLKKNLERKTKKTTAGGESSHYLPYSFSESKQTQHHATLNMAPRSAVTIKHKTSRSLDPDAIIRIKQRLGLNKK